MNVRSLEGCSEMDKTKKILISIGIVIALVLMFVIWGISVNNSVIRKEEQIKESSSSITVQLKKRSDSVKQLVQVVEEYSEHEQSIMTSVSEARNYAESGNAEQASLIISAIAEQYPDLKASQSYNNLMNEISINENGLKEYRENYNHQVKNYKKFIRQVPNKWFLDMSGYEPVEYDYLELEDDYDVSNIFGE